MLPFLMLKKFNFPTMMLPFSNINVPIFDVNILLDYIGCEVSSCRSLPYHCSVNFYAIKASLTFLEASYGTNSKILCWKDANGIKKNYCGLKKIIDFLKNLTFSNKFFKFMHSLQFQVISNNFQKIYVLFTKTKSFIHKICFRFYYLEHRDCKTPVHHGFNFSWTLKSYKWL